MKHKCGAYIKYRNHGCMGDSCIQCKHEFIISIVHDSTLALNPNQCLYGNKHIRNSHTHNLWDVNGIQLCIGEKQNYSTGTPKAKGKRTAKRGEHLIIVHKTYTLGLLIDTNMHFIVTPSSNKLLLQMPKDLLGNQCLAARCSLLRKLFCYTICDVFLHHRFRRQQVTA